MNSKLFCVTKILALKMGAVKLTEEKFKKWKRKRRTTFIVFWLSHFLIGIFNNLFRTTCFLYIKTHFKTRSPDLIYSFVTGIRFLPVLMFTFIVSGLHDKYRKTRLILIIINYFTIIGGILYIIDSSYYFPIIGSFLSGFQYLAQSIAVGEMSRSYTPKDITYKVPVLQLGFFLGALPAAIVPYCMKGVKFNIGPFFIDYSNILGVLMVITLSLIQILNVTFVHDLSLEYDLKECFLRKEKQKKLKHEREDLCKVKTENLKTKENILKEINEYSSRNSNIANSLKKLFSDYDLVLIYYLVWLFYYFFAFVAMYLPVIVLKELRYEVEILNILYLMFSVLLLIFLPFLILFKVGSKTAYYIGFISFSLFVPVVVCFRMTDIKQGRLYNILLLIVAMIMFAITTCGEDIFLTCTISKLVKPDIQTFADGVRLILCMFGCITATTGSITFAENHTNILFTGLLMALLFSLVLLIKRRKTLMNPETIM